MQRNYRLAVTLHTEVLVAKRVFWENLLHVNVTFDKLARCISRIETTTRAAERMYKQVRTACSSSATLGLLSTAAQ